jgi:hypothetical protein
MGIRGRGMGRVSGTPQKPAPTAADKQKTRTCSIYPWHELILGLRFLWSPIVVHVPEKVAHGHGVGDVQGRHGASGGLWVRRLSTTLELSCP